MLDKIAEAFGYERKRSHVDDLLAAVGVLEERKLEAVRSARYAIVGEFDVISRCIADIPFYPANLDIRDNIVSGVLDLVAKRWVADDIYQIDNPPRPSSEFYTELGDMGRRMYAALRGCESDGFEGKNLTIKLQEISRSIHTKK